jgi:hypothetical protein
VPAYAEFKVFFGWGLVYPEVGLPLVDVVDDQVLFNELLGRVRAPQRVWVF